MLFGYSKEAASEPQVMIPTALGGRRLSLTLGLLQGNDEPLIKKQIKRSVSIHGNIRQVCVRVKCRLICDVIPKIGNI